MLCSLEVHALGVVEHAQLTFGAHMTVLTGETGAGKTLLVEALQLICGGRADLALIRPGADAATVKASFVHDGLEVVVERVLPREGRTRALINGRSVSASELRDEVASYLEIHGQHEAQSLFEPTAAREALDRFGEIDGSALATARLGVARLNDALARLGGDAETAQRALELQQFEFDQLSAAQLTSDHELDELSSELERLGSAEAVKVHAARTAELLVGGDEGLGARDLLRQALREVEGVLGARSVLDAGLLAVDALNEFVERVREFEATLEVDPERIDEIATRISLLKGFIRRYGTTLSDVITAREELADQLRAAEQLGTDREVIEASLEAALAALRIEEDAMLALRRAAAPLLASAVESTLVQLGMPHCQFLVAVDDEAGGDGVTFLFSANPGMRPLELARVASGGELSRVMLALHLAVPNGPGSLIFDEIDTGVGGVAASALGSFLADLATNRQVFVVTHLAQVAAFGDVHLLVAKATTDSLAKTTVRELNTIAREIEIARLLSGSPDSPTALAHARELLARSSP
jgi:DNA repair protein RecN (Recombination protein N)